MCRGDRSHLWGRASTHASRPKRENQDPRKKGKLSCNSLAVTEADGVRFLSPEGARLRHVVAARKDLGHVEHTFNTSDTAAATSVDTSDTAAATPAGPWFTACKELAEHDFLDWRFVFGVPLAPCCNPGDKIAVCLPFEHWFAEHSTLLPGAPDELEVLEHAEVLEHTNGGGKNGGGKNGGSKIRRANIDCFVVDTCKSWGPTPSDSDGSQVKPSVHHVLHGIEGDTHGPSLPGPGAQSSSDSTAAVASIIHDCNHCTCLSDVPTASGPGVLEARTGINWALQCAFKIISRTFKSKRAGSRARRGHHGGRQGAP